MLAPPENAALLIESKQEMNTLITQLRGERDSLKSAINAVCDSAAAENRDLNETEDTNLTDLAEKLAKVNARLEQLEAIELRNAAGAELSAKVDANGGETRSVHVRKDEDIYRPDGGPSYFRDLVMATRGDFDAMDRQTRHNRSFQARDNSTTATAGGEFNPPVYLTSKFAELSRSGRPVANLIPSAGAPSSTVFKVPTITTGSAIAVQASENSSLGEQDFVSAEVTVNVATLGGFVDQSMQLLDFADVAWDSIVFNDLARAYATQVESAVIQRNATGFKGLRHESNIISVTYTDSDATAAETYTSLADAVQQIHTNRYEAPEVIVMHPRRWAFFLSAADTTGRPLVSAQAPQNAMGNMNGLAAQGAVGSIMGLPVVTSASIPVLSTDATPVDQDEIYVLRPSDMLLWESPLKTLVDPYVGSANGTVRLRLHAYVGFTCARYPKSVAKISGTGLNNPW